MEAPKVILMAEHASKCILIQMQIPGSSISTPSNQFKLGEVIYIHSPKWPNCISSLHFKLDGVSWSHKIPEISETKNMEDYETNLLRPVILRSQLKKAFSQFFSSQLKQSRDATGVTGQLYPRDPSKKLLEPKRIPMLYTAAAGYISWKIDFPIAPDPLQRIL